MEHGFVQKKGKYVGASNVTVSGFWFPDTHWRYAPCEPNIDFWSGKQEIPCDLGTENLEFSL
jgi:hypothetical protein